VIHANQQSKYYNNFGMLNQRYQVGLILAS
jgi:hypothetical protein